MRGSMLASSRQIQHSARPSSALPSDSACATTPSSAASTTSASTALPALQLAPLSASISSASGSAHGEKTLGLPPSSEAALPEVAVGPEAAMSPLVPSLERNSGNSSQNSGSALLKAWDCLDKRCLVSVDSCKTPKLLGSFSSIMKDMRPTRMDSIVHAGFQLSGWKSVMLRHNRWFVSSRPLGVSIISEGGESGYRSGNVSLPW
mmetsp:Transcript_128617/g.274406  ORF Transcript_128617/g.274406 Transcript_128617/m.274406 type:complete len:205 (-) Transcript_128617:205-819(-)